MRDNGNYATPWRMPILRICWAADPYHNTGQAMGLSFSVPQGTPVPSSLQNIYRELNTDLGCTRPKHGCLLKVCAITEPSCSKQRWTVPQLCTPRQCVRSGQPAFEYV